MGTLRASSPHSQGGLGAAQLDAWQTEDQYSRLCSHRQANFTHCADPLGQTDAGLFVFLGSPCLKSWLFLERGPRAY